MWDKIGYALLATVGAGAVWLIRSLFLARPKLLVSYKAGDGLSSMGSGADRLAVRWGYTVRITNVTKHDAYEIQVVSTTNPDLQKLPEHHIAGVKEMVLDQKLAKELDRAAVLDAHHDFHGELEPAELRDLAIVLRYKAEGVPFSLYTVYKRVNGIDTNAHPLRAPKRA